MDKLGKIRVSTGFSDIDSENKEDLRETKRMYNEWTETIALRDLHKQGKLFLTKVTNVVIHRFH